MLHKTPPRKRVRGVADADEHPADVDGKSVTLTLTHRLYDSFPSRKPLIEARVASGYWERRIGRHARTLTTAIIARAYERGRGTQQYAIERIERLSKAELAELSELHRGWVEEPENRAEHYYVLFLS